MQIWQETGTNPKLSRRTGTIIDCPSTLTYNMAEERKIGVSFSFSKRKPAIKSYSSEKNALSIDEDKVKDDEKDYIHSAEEKELKRYISVACSPGQACSRAI